jgi:membrane-associated phospholipid phosphatase
MNEKAQINRILLCLAFFTCAGVLRSQGVTDGPGPSSRKSLIVTLGEDILHILRSPFRLKKKDSPKLLTFAATTAVFVASLDRRIDDDFIERDDLYVKSAIGFAKIGDGFDKISAKYVFAGLSLPMLAGGLIFNDKKLLETTRLMAESFLIAGGITWTGKRLFGRSRPFTGEGPNEFQLFKLNVERERRSFPSGHATSAFSMMTVLAKQYDKWWMEIPAYTVAVSVALQRIESHQHWGADVAVGSVIGYWVGSTLVSRHKGETKAASVNTYFLGNRVAFIVSF